MLERNWYSTNSVYMMQFGHKGREVSDSASEKFLRNDVWVRQEGVSSLSKGHRAFQLEEQDTGIKWDMAMEKSVWLDCWSHKVTGRKGH